MGKTAGIDLGTTNSLIAFVNSDGRPEVIPVDGEKRLLKSVAAFTDEGALVGSSARELSVKIPDRVVYSVKRLMGKGIRDLKGEDDKLAYRLVQDTDGIIRIDLGDRTITPPEVSALILKELKRKAENFLGETVERAVITVPAYFNDSERQATRDAGRIAGLDVIRILNEPTAASLAYGLDKLAEGRVAVYDLGGGTFDISILKIKDGIFEVLATAGDTRLGGDDIDIAFVDYIKETIRRDRGTVEFTQADGAVLLNEAVRVKHVLSAEEETDFSVKLDSLEFRRRITRKEFEEVAAPVTGRTIPPVRQALADAKLRPEDIDEVVLVGGMTRMPLVRKTVAEIFGKEGLCEINPDEVVAIGAAVQADILTGGRRDMLLLDVIPLSLGIETFGGTMTKIIHRNSTIPASATEMFTTFVDNQTGVDIHVLQGEREFAADCRSLARFRIRIQPQPAGIPRVEVKFLVDANGILNVAAIDQRTGAEQGVSVKPTYGLTDEDVEKMILESFEYAEKDVTERLLVEAKQEAELVLKAVEKALSGGPSEILEKGELDAIMTARDELRKSLEGGDRDAIRENLDSLNASSGHLAELMMDEAVKQALKGKRL